MNKKQAFPFFLFLLLILSGCSHQKQPAKIAATTLPVYRFTTALCEGTGLSVDRLITDSVSCLHDYSLNVDQVRAAEAAELIVISGAGLEDFMDDILDQKPHIDCSEGIPLLCSTPHDHESADEHDSEEDPHIWLSPINASKMAENICSGLCKFYPEYSSRFSENLSQINNELFNLQSYGEEMLSNLSCREMITFHDGFSYFADAFSLTILDAVEEESGSEASAHELIHLISLTREHHIPALFTEKNGSPSAAAVISAETGCRIFSLDMAMSDTDYFDAMYQNINTIKEAMG